MPLNIRAGYWVGNPAEPPYISRMPDDPGEYTAEFLRRVCIEACRPAIRSGHKPPTLAWHMSARLWATMRLVRDPQAFDIDALFGFPVEIDETVEYPMLALALRSLSAD